MEHGVLTLLWVWLALGEVPAEKTLGLGHSCPRTGHAFPVEGLAGEGNWLFVKTDWISDDENFLLYLWRPPYNPPSIEIFSHSTLKRPLNSRAFVQGYRGTPNGQEDDIMQTIVSKIRSLALVVSIAGLVSACAAGNVSYLEPVSSEDLAKVRIDAVNVEIQTVKKHPLLAEIMQSEITRAMDLCATGTEPHTLTVEITEFDEASSGQAFLIGDSAEIQGKVKLTNNATGQSAGAFVVERSLSGGGIIGAAVLANAEGALSEDFANAVCEDVFDFPIADG